MIIDKYSTMINNSINLESSKLQKSEIMKLFRIIIDVLYNLCKYIYHILQMHLQHRLSIKVVLETQKYSNSINPLIWDSKNL